jgi:hydroxyacylglutathione hydrolase
MIVERIENNIYTSNSYLVYDGFSSDAWLVDVGDFDKIIEILPKGKSIIGAFITHAHHDHIYGLNALLQYNPDTIVYASGFTKEGLFSEKMNLSFYRECPFVYNGNDISEIKESDKIQIFGSSHVDVIETPGHNSGSTSFKIDNYLFTGDSYIPGYDVVTKLKSGNKLLAELSLKKIFSYINSSTVLCPGHGPMYMNHVPDQTIIKD